LAYLGKALYGTFKGAVDVNKIFTASINTTEKGIFNQVDTYAALSASAALYGASSEEALTALRKVTSGYGINSMVMEKGKKSQDEYLVSAAGAIGKTVGLGKMMEMSADQTGDFITSLTTMGESVEDVAKSFILHAGASKLAMITMSDYAKAMKALAPVSMLVSNSTERMRNMMVGFGDTLKSTDISDPILKLVASRGAMAQWSTAVTQFTQAAAKMDLPTLLAFGGGAQAGMPGGLTAAMDKAAQAFQPDVLRSYLSAINSGITDQRDKVGGMTMALMRMGMDFREARTMSGLMAEQMKKIQNATGDAKKREQAVMKGLEEQAMASAAVKDPLQYIANLMERGLGYLMVMAGTGGTGFVTSMITRIAGK